MRFITHRSTRFMLPGLAIAAVVLATSALPASAAAARSSAPSSCDTTPVFFGVHGMGEGPDPTNSSLGLSTLIGDLDDAQNNLSGAVLVEPVSYHATALTDLLTIKNFSNAFTKAVQGGENALQGALTSYTAGCTVSQDDIVLVGYSMGAWVINKWLMQHHKEWKMIKGMLLYGDPCSISGSDEGLARAYGYPGCMPAKSYPAPVSGSSFKIPVEDWCASLDPVCGAGFGAVGNAVNLGLQDGAVAACLTPLGCPHFAYWSDGADTSYLTQGASYMVQWLGVPVLA